MKVRTLIQWSAGKPRESEGTNAGRNECERDENLEFKPILSRNQAREV